MTEDQTRLVEENTNLVWEIVHRYFKPTRSQTKEDLFQAGCIGLIGAAKRFDPSKGCEFSTYAHKGIRNSIWTQLNRDKAHNVKCNSLYGLINGTDLRLEETLHDNTDHIDSFLTKDQARWVLRQCSSRERFILCKHALGFTYREIGDMLGISRERVRQLNNRAKEKLIRLTQEIESRTTQPQC